MASILFLLLMGCLKDTATRSYTYKLYRPVYKTSNEVRANIKNAAPKTISSSGKMYLLGSTIFLSEPGVGIHIINNENPKNPINESFITIPGCENMAATGHTLYADCYTDLVVMDISNPKNVVVKKIIPNLFPQRQYVLGFQIDSGHVIADWITKDTTVTEKMDIDQRNGNAYIMDYQSATTNSSGPSKANGVGGSMAQFAIQAAHLYTVSTNQLTVFHHQTAVRVFKNAAGRMGHHNDRHALRTQRFHPLIALVLETNVANRQRLVDN